MQLDRRTLGGAQKELGVRQCEMLEWRGLVSWRAVYKSNTQYAISTGQENGAAVPFSCPGPSPEGPKAPWFNPKRGCKKKASVSPPRPRPSGGQMAT